MIKFQKKTDGSGKEEKRKYLLTISDPVYGEVTKEVKTVNENGEEVTNTVTEQGIVDWTLREVVKEMDLVYSPGSNKYGAMLEFVERCSQVMGQEFDDFYIGTIKTYVDSGCDVRIIQNAVPGIIEWCDKFIDAQNINFDGYINKSKASKSSIFFDANEIKEIIRAACYLKLYYTIHKDMTMKLAEKFNREIFQKLVHNLTSTQIIFKLYKIVSSKTFEYNHTDKFMWEYIRNLCCKTPDMHISHIFNFIVSNILVTCEVDQNPIPYLISVIDESIKWVLKSIYKESIIYSDAISTQDVTAVSGKDNLETYAHNNTIGMLTILAYQELENIFDTDEKIESYKTSIESIKESSIFAMYFTYPLLSKITDIPYRHFLTLSISTSYLMNMLVYSLTKGTQIEQDYPNLCKILTFYNTQKPIAKTTYKLKNVSHFTKTFDSFLGFKNYTTAYDIYSSIIGKINKNEYFSFMTGNVIPNFPSAKVEQEIIEFYNKYFSTSQEKNLDNEIESLRTRIDLQI